MRGGLVTVAGGLVTVGVAVRFSGWDVLPGQFDPGSILGGCDFDAVRELGLNGRAKIRTRLVFRSAARPNGGVTKGSLAGSSVVCRL